ncbi:hypothetical protein B0F90DRAFT_1707482 [Multifurca ochricompacta]|uniref:Uncharacterized protein n=1 Tax=Multifurca ochricompacta TaxID=376703 RepID=A0AAD4M6W4_9AGAM|nr:hypothetical protein B0F90DRAFT_1707482 [Multifurca ochricompacta]
MALHWKRDVHSFTELKYYVEIIQFAHPTTGTMTVPFQRRTQSSIAVSPHQDESAVPPHVPETSGHHSKSPLATPTGGVTKPTSKAHNSYIPPTRSFALGSGYLPGLYTAIAHNGDLRRRIQESPDDFEEFQMHLRRVQELLFGWLVMLYHLVVVVTWYTLVIAIARLTVGLFKRYTTIVKSRIPFVFVRSVNRAKSLRCNISANYLPVDFTHLQAYNSSQATPRLGRGSEFRS